MRETTISTEAISGLAHVVVDGRSAEPGLFAIGVARGARRNHERPALAHAKHCQTTAISPLAQQNKGSSAALAVASADLACLGRRFERIQAHDARAHWSWAHDLLAIHEAGRAGLGERLTEAEIGRRLAGSERPAYSRSWVAHALNAARLWPTAPRSVQERRDFMCDFYGHRRRKRAARVTAEEQVRRVLGRCRQVARDALKWASPHTRQRAPTCRSRHLDYQVREPP